MPHFYNYKKQGAAVVLYHSGGAIYCPTLVAAEQKLLSSINCWAREDVKKAEQEMALLTGLLRSV